jgi:hypothetical protein
MKAHHRIIIGVHIDRVSGQEMSRARTGLWHRAHAMNWHPWPDNGLRSKTILEGRNRRMKHDETVWVVSVLISNGSFSPNVVFLSDPPLQPKKGKHDRQWALLWTSVENCSCLISSGTKRERDQEPYKVYYIINQCTMYINHNKDTTWQELFQELFQCRKSCWYCLSLLFVFHQRYSVLKGKLGTVLSIPARIQVEIQAPQDGTSNAEVPHVHFALQRI